jgi:CheY-like chemotaxis protein
MTHSAPDILLVEDSPGYVKLLLLARECNKSTCTMHVVGDGAEAVDYLLGGEAGLHAERRALPKLVLLDLHSPRLNGFEVLARLRADERTRRLCVVVFSASDEASDEDECRRLLANGFIRKPAGFAKLCDTLIRLERDWLGPALRDNSTR